MSGNGAAKVYVTHIIQKQENNSNKNKTKQEQEQVAAAAAATATAAFSPSLRGLGVKTQ